jgi:TPR repeat protein
MRQQDATSAASQAASIPADQTPVELAASRPMAAAPEAQKQPTPAPQSEAANAASVPLKLGADIISALIRRGDAMLATGDISAARLLYQPAAEAGSGPAAAALGRTFDPAFLASIGAIGIQPDPSAAAKWYQRADSLGEPGMEEAIKHLELVPAAAKATSGGR